MGDNPFLAGLQGIVAQSSQAAVARKAGLSQGPISKLLHGKTQGHLETARKLIVAYPQLGRFFVPENIPNGIPAGRTE